MWSTSSTRDGKQLAVKFTDYTAEKVEALYPFADANCGPNGATRARRDHPDALEERGIELR